MIVVRALAVLVCGAMLSNGSVNAQDFSRYRVFQLGRSLSSVAQAANMGPSDARVIHRRPALIQELDWRPQYQPPTSRIAMDPVLDVALTFYNDQLFRITITYDQSRTDGMTNADVIEAVSATYGLAAVPATPRASPRSSQSSRNDAITIARWANGDRTLTLSRSVFPVVFQLVMMSTTLNDLAEASVAEAVISPDEADEALQREADRRKKELAEAIADQDRTRLRNKGAFHP
ncbi:MAG: hypothetical protein ABW292_15125 [Vicinamibacterales bacterium]